MNKGNMKITDLIPKNTNNIISNRVDLDDGYYINTFYPFLPGIIVFFNEVHASGIPIGTFSNENEIIVMNYCISGRCEFRTNTDKYRYLTDNNLSISRYVVRESFFYPTGFYIGFEVGMIEDLFTDKTRETLKEYGIDIDNLKNNYLKGNELHISKANSTIQKIWLDMYANHDNDTVLMKLNMLKILRILSKEKLEKSKKTVYLTRGQMYLAKAVHHRLTEDISVHVSMREISEELNVNESSLKKYFKIMFDMNVSEYMRTTRLKKAAKMLTETQKSVFDIADLCGYTNQGRFAKVFKEYYGMRPLEYRHVVMSLKNSRSD